MVKPLAVPGPVFVNVGVDWIAAVWDFKELSEKFLSKVPATLKATPIVPNPNSWVSTDDETIVVPPATDVYSTEKFSLL